MLSGGRNSVHYTQASVQDLNDTAPYIGYYTTKIQNAIKSCIYFEDWVDFTVSQRLGL